jgi:hypothetical protein
VEIRRLEYYIDWKLFIHADTHIESRGINDGQMKRSVISSSDPSMDSISP